MYTQQKRVAPVEIADWLTCRMRSGPGVGRQTKLQPWHVAKMLGLEIDAPNGESRCHYITWEKIKIELGFEFAAYQEAVDAERAPASDDAGALPSQPGTLEEPEVLPGVAAACGKGKPAGRILS